MAGDFKPSFKGIASSIFPDDFWGQPVYLDAKGKAQCPGFQGATYAVNQWDFVNIGDMKTPGICEVSAHKFRDLDKKKQKGNDGARLTVHGVEPALIEIKVTIWTPDQLNELRNVWLTIFPPPQKITTTTQVQVPGPSRETKTLVGRNPATGELVFQTTIIPTFSTKNVTNTKTSTPIKYFDVLHPVFTTHKINSVLFLSGEGPTPGGIPRSRVFVIKGIENLKVGTNDVTATPKQSIAQKTLFSENYQPPGNNQANAGPKAR